MIIFEIVRRKPSLQRIYYTRLQYTPHTRLTIPTGLFEWLKTVFLTPESILLHEIGLDALMFLRYMYICFWILLFTWILVIVVLLPINIFQPSSNGTNETIVLNGGTLLQVSANGLSNLSITKVPDGSGLLWIHVLCCYLISGLCYYLLYGEYKIYTTYNIEVAKNDPGVVENLQQRTILINNLTPELCNKAKLKKWFDDLAIGEVTEINMNTSQDYQLLQRLHLHHKLLRKLESAYMYWAIQIYKTVEKDAWRVWTKLSPQKLIEIHETPMSDIYKEKASKHSFRCRPLFFEAANGTIKRYDVINSLTYKINTLENEIDNLRTQTFQVSRQLEPRSNSNLTATLNRIYKDFEKYSVSAFVTFDDRRGAIMARQLLLHSALDTTTMQITQAPVPNDIIWDSLSRTLFDRLIKRNAVLLLVWCICILWVIPTYYISTIPLQLMQIPAWRSYMENYPDTALFITSCISPILILISTAIMPYILDYLSYLGCWDSLTEIQEATLSQYFYFLLFNVHFVYTIISSAWVTSSELYIHPLSWVERVANSFPSGSAFFINYLILNLSVFSVELLRPVPALYYLFMRQFITTPREFLELSNLNSYLNYGWIYPFQILIFLIVISYSVISPLVVLPGVVYFAFGYIVYKNQLMYVYIKPIQGQGKYWKMAFDRSVAGIGLFQFLSAGILSAKQAAYPSILVGILIPVTVYFHSICERSFGKQNLIPLEVLRKTPCADEEENKLEENSIPGQTPQIQIEVTHSQPMDPVENTVTVLQLKSPTTPLFPSRDLAAIQAKSDDYRSPSKSLKLPRLWIPEYISHLINENDADNLANIEEDQLSITNMNWSSIQNLRS
ncbi:hypothetical protein HDV06_003260 [Boothiomyces sp. JEL0866]|nr:hypothetical protein HDV06_003260 [Boothiomyces sp. JEL0866]